MTRKLQDYVREAIRASSVEILRFNKESLKSMETRIRAVVYVSSLTFSRGFFSFNVLFSHVSLQFLRLSENGLFLVILFF